MAFSLINLLVLWELLPSGYEQLSQYQASLEEYFYALIVLIIFLESIVYVGFYFPGQFFAVLLVISATPTFGDIIKLTIAMVMAATMGSLVNYGIGRLSTNRNYVVHQRTPLGHLLLAMIHMNSLAFFMMAQGAKQRSVGVVFLAGLLNLPYYLALIAVTVFLSEEVMLVAENTVFLFSLLFIWLGVALWLDVKQHSTKGSLLTKH